MAASIPPGAKQDRRVPTRDHREPDPNPPDDQRGAFVAGNDHGYGRTDPDLHADLPAGHELAGDRPPAVRHDPAGEPWAGPLHAASWHMPVRGLRRRQATNGKGRPNHLALLSGDFCGADADHVRARNFFDPAGPS